MKKKIIKNSLALSFYVFLSMNINIWYS